MARLLDEPPGGLGATTVVGPDDDRQLVSQGPKTGTPSTVALLTGVAETQGPFADRWGQLSIGGHAARQLKR